MSMTMMLPMVLFMLLVLGAIALAIWAIARGARRGGETGQLHRSPDDRVVAGVAGGMAEHWDMDATLVRVVWVVAGLFPMTAPIALVAYIILAVTLPIRSARTETDHG